MLSTTNLIESVNSKIHKATDSKRVFPDDDSLMKVVYGAILELESKWAKPMQESLHKIWDTPKKVINH